MLLSRTLLLKAEPAGSLRSLDELFALANAMELEASRRYDDLAADMERQKKFDLAAVFAQLAAAEREHVDVVGRWSQSRRGKAPDPALVRWEMPDTIDAEAANDIRTSRLTTPYRALAMAVRNEERAFAFWSYVAAFSEDPEIKQAAETMAVEELEHVSILRRERRRAYRADETVTRSPRSDGLEGSQIDARTLELRLAAQLADFERGLGKEAAARARELVDQTIQMSTKAEGVGKFPAALELQDAETISETLVDAYLEGAERSHEQEQVLLLQELAGKAIARLAWLRSLTKQ
jgi:rubrerythrin